MNNPLPTKELSHCCEMPVYTTFSGPQVLKEWEEKGLKRFSDFKPFTEVVCCSGCHLPCLTYHEMSLSEEVK